MPKVTEEDFVEFKQREFKLRPPAGPPTSEEILGFKEALSVCTGANEYCSLHPQRKKAYMNENDVTKHLCEMCILDP